MIRKMEMNKRLFLFLFYLCICAVSYTHLDVYKRQPAGRNMVYSTESHSFEGVDYEDDGDKFPTAKWQSDTFRNCLLYTSPTCTSWPEKPNVCRSRRATLPDWEKAMTTTLR